MPKSGPPRTIQAEQNLSRRVRIERERQEWSYESTAKRMTDVGCPMQGSTVYKIERQQPPRRISANELAAFALIFRISETELVRSPEVAEDAQLVELLSAAAEIRTRANDAMREWLRIRRVVGVHVGRCDRDAAQRLSAAAAAIGAPDLADGPIWLGGETVYSGGPDGTGESWHQNDAEFPEDGDAMPLADDENVRAWLAGELSP